MPTYEFSCDSCQKHEDKWMRISEYHAPRCCGKEMHQVITAPSMVMPDIQPYQSTIDGSIISSRSQHKRHLKDHGCVEVGNDSCLQKPHKPLTSPPGLKDHIIRAVDQTMHKRRG